MGGILSNDKVEPESELEEVEKRKRSPEPEENVVSRANRSCTDVIWLMLMIAFLISLIGLVIYCISHGDIYRIVNGYDHCGNVCGRVTPVDTSSNNDFSCKGANMTDKKYLLIREAGKAIINPYNVHRQCVRECPTNEGFREFLNRCVPTPSREFVNKFFSKTGLADFLEEVSEDLQMCWLEILYMCLIALGFSIILFILFRFFVGIVVWVVLIGVVLVSVTACVYFWVIWKHNKNQLKRESEQSDIEKRNVNAYLVYAIIATIVAVIVLLVILIMRKRIQLVVQLFKEAGKALNSMPLLFLQPVLTFLTLVGVVAIWLYFSLIIESSGNLTSNGTLNLYYEKDGAMKFTRWYNLLGLFWFVQFVIGCQHMVIAGAVATWFFTRNKDQLGSPIFSSFHNLTRFHLGTVALGSLLISIVQFIRAILSFIENSLKETENQVMKWILRGCQCFLWCFEQVLKYLSRNAYIITAMQGLSFCKAGQEAFKLLSSNALRVAAINSVGDFVLFLGKALVVIATVLIGFEILKAKEGLQHTWVPLALAGLFAYLVAHCFITVYEMAIDTIFLCFCEDCEQNDGINKHYYMSRGLMEFVANSKKALEIYDSRQGAWSGATTRSVK